MNTIENVQAKIGGHLDGDAKQVIVAYSGGVDSHVLLHLVAAIRKDFPQHQYLAVHINHGLQPEALQWQEHCQRQCELLEIPFQCIQVQVDKNSKQGIEAAAREQRYKALRSCASDSALIFLGQHLNDQAETVLLQLKRGAGIKGLSAMPEVNLHSSGTRFVRPLINLSRSHIDAYAQQAKLHWIEDPSNDDLRYDRNFLRNEIMPKLEKRWPGFSQAAARSAALSAQQQTLIDDVSDERLMPMIDEDGSICIAKLLEYSVPWQHQLVRSWLEKKQVAMPSKAIMDELPKLFHAKNDAEPVIQLQFWQLRRFRNRLYCVKHCKPLSPEVHIAMTDKTLVHPSGLGQLLIAQDLLQSAKIVGAYKSVFSEKIKPQGAAHSKPLKQWFKAWDVAPWHREQSITVTLDNIPAAIWVNGKVIKLIELPPSISVPFHCQAHDEAQ